MSSLNECDSNPVTNDRYLGAINRNASYFCTIQTQRVPVGVFCCTPSSSDTVRLLVSTPSTGETEIKFHDASGAKYLKNETKVVFIAHGWIENVTTSMWVNRTRDGFLERGCAVVVVDWGRINSISYWQSIAM